MRRKIIAIDQEKCNGCGLCATGCPEGALKVIDGKARLVGDLLCDGLGACIGTCPENAITVEEREAAPYDELKVLENIIPQGPNVLKAHLEHLRDHGQTDYLQQAVALLRQKGIPVELAQSSAPAHAGGHQCPGSRSMAFAPLQDAKEDSAAFSQNAALSESAARPSRLTHWPIQLHLISPAAPQYRNSDLLIAADCVAFSYADFHKDYLKGRSLAIACPKLDVRQEVYVEKLTALIDQAEVQSITVMIMQVPCCRGLLQEVVEAAGHATRKIPIRYVVVGLQGEILQEAPIQAAPRP